MNSAINPLLRTQDPDRGPGRDEAEHDHPGVAQQLAQEGGGQLARVRGQHPVRVGRAHGPPRAQGHPGKCTLP